MEIALIVLAVIGAISIVLLICFSGSTLIGHGNDIEKLERWIRDLSDNINTLVERNFDLKCRIDDLEEMLTDKIVSKYMTEPGSGKSRK